jgi:hypothetical protein
MFFPKVLPSMSLDRDIEFVVELISSIALIFKKPYRMDVNSLVELT